MDKKKLKASTLLRIFTGFSIFTGIFFLSMLGILVYSLIKQNNFAVYMSLIELPILAFLTSFFITQTVKIKKDADKNEQEESGKIER